MALPPLRAAFAALAVACATTASAENVARGRDVFRAHCMQCHGEKADGRGPLASRYKPPPADITATTRTDDYLLQIVTLGGEAMGRSAVMPEWGLELSGSEILDVVAYLRQRVNETRRRTAAAGLPR